MKYFHSHSHIHSSFVLCTGNKHIFFCFLLKLHSLILFITLIKPESWSFWHFLANNLYEFYRVVSSCVSASQHRKVYIKKVQLGLKGVMFWSLGQTSSNPTLNWAISHCHKKIELNKNRVVRGSIRLTDGLILLMAYASLWNVKCFVEIVSTWKYWDSNFGENSNSIY